MKNAIKVIARDLERAVLAEKHSDLLGTLGMMFNPTRFFYQKPKSTWR